MLDEGKGCGSVAEFLTYAWWLGHINLSTSTKKTDLGGTEVQGEKTAWDMQDPVSKEKT